jgi:hypothetical protein
MRAARQAASDAERRFPVRIRIGIPPEGLATSIRSSRGSTPTVVPMGGPNQSTVASAKLPFESGGLFVG